MKQDELAIEAKGIGKKFAKKRKVQSPLKNRIDKILNNPISSYAENVKSTEETWGLKNITFSLNKGEVLGIVGHNGAGKSLLFKILARITYPTVGRAVVNGSLIAMLEVNDSFHHELTGSENIYLSAATYGLKNSAIEALFPDIIELAEVRHFLDTPLKQYSSGMRLKLAFAIAIMVQPDILILDEVLAVSDQAFRKTSIELLKQHSREGQTQLIVSHDHKILEELCTKILWLERGEIKAFDEAEKVLLAYLANRL